MDVEGVAGEDGAAPFYFVGAHEVADLADILRSTEHEDGGNLGHGFELEHAGHDGVFGEVTGEERLVHGHVLQPGTLVVAFEIDDSVDEEEGVTVGEKLHDIVDIENGFSLGDFERRSE